jgi:hypothetical protein
MPCTLAVPFKPTYKLKTSCIETVNDFEIQGVEWTAQAKVQVTETTNHTIKVGFIQAIKSYEMKVDYRDSILECKLDWTPMCDRESGELSTWYEASELVTGFGCSPEVTGPTARPVIVTPQLGDHPSAPVSWRDDAHRQKPGNNDVQRARRKEQFQTWLVAHDTDADTWTTLYCFSYSIDQVVSIDLSKAVGSRCKVEVGASSQASAPTTYSQAPFPKIPTFRPGCANDNQAETYTIRRA